MRKFILLTAVIICAAISVSAQSAKDQKYHFEVTKGTAGMQAPAVKDGRRYVITVSKKPGVVQLGPRTTYLKEGLSTEEVLRVMGRPTAVSERNEQGSTVTSYEFERGDGRVLIAEFVDNALVRSRTETHEPMGTVEGLTN